MARDRRLTVTVAGDSSGLDGMLESAGGALTRFAQVAAVTVGAGAAAVGAGLFEAIDREQITDRLAASLGATGAEAERFGNIASSLYRDAWGDSLEEVADAVGRTQNILGDVMAPDALEQSTAFALDFADVMDEDLSAVLRSVGQLMRNDLAGSAEEAFDLIAAGQGAGLNRSEDLLDTINEYAPAFQRLGLTGNQALGLLSQGLEAGVFNTDKIGDAFNELSIRAIDGSVASVEAVQSLGLNYEDTAATIARGGRDAAVTTGNIITRLRLMNDEIAQDAAGVALFGSMWEDLGADAILALDPMSAGLTDVDGAASTLSDTLNDNLGTRLDSLRRRFTDAFVNIAEDYIVPIIERVLDLGAGIANAFQEGGLEGVVEFFEDEFGEDSIIANVADTLVTGFRALQDFWVNDFAPAAAAVFEGLAEYWTNDLVPAAQSAWPTIRSWITGAMDAIRQSVEIGIVLWERFGDNIIGFVVPAARTLWRSLGRIIEIVDGLVQFVGALLTGRWGDAWDAFYQVVSNAVGLVWDSVVFLKDTLVFVFTSIIDALSVIWDYTFLSDIVEGAVDAVVGFFQALPGRLFGIILRVGAVAAVIGSAIYRGVVSIAGKVIEWVGDLPRHLWNAVLSILRAIRDIGAAIGRAIWDGIKSAIGSIKDLIPGGGIVGDVLDLGTSLVPSHTGGTFRAVSGEGLALLRDGQHVSNPGQGGGNGGGVARIELILDGHRLGEAVVDVMDLYAQNNGSVPMRVRALT